MLNLDFQCCRVVLERHHCRFDLCKEEQARICYAEQFHIAVDRGPLCAVKCWSKKRKPKLRVVRYRQLENQLTTFAGHILQTSRRALDNRGAFCLCHSMICTRRSG